MPDQEPTEHQVDVNKVIQRLRVKNEELTYQLTIAETLIEQLSDELASSQEKGEVE